MSKRVPTGTDPHWIVFYFAPARTDDAWTSWDRHFHTHVIVGALPCYGDIQARIHATNKHRYVHVANIEITGILSLPSQAAVDAFLSPTKADGTPAPAIPRQPRDCTLL